MVFIGADGGTWTPTHKALDPKSSASANSATSAYGGPNRARTCDPLLVRQVLSQLSYEPTNGDP